MFTPTNNLNELQTLVELTELRYNELLTNDTQTILDMLHDSEHKLTNIREHTLIVESLVNDRDIYSTIVNYATKTILMSVNRELPLIVLSNTIAETLTGRKASNRLRIATVIIKLLQTTGLFSLFYKLSQEGFKERIVNLKYTITDATKTELAHKVRKLPTNIPTKSLDKVAGHRKKLSNNNSHMLDITDKLNQVGYTLDQRIWDKFKYELAAYRFDDMKTQDAMITEGDLLLNKVFYFNHRFGPDNGRIYCDGDLFTLQGGALNYAYKFADKRILSEEGMEVLQAKVDELHAKDILPFKEVVEMYSLTLDLIDAKEGRPVGTILHQDAKLSGLQHQSIALRDYEAALYCGLLSNIEDGYTHIRNSLSNKDTLTRDMVKKAYNPYQYGAGGRAVVNAVVNAGGALDFAEWEMAYKDAYPRAYELRTFLLSIASTYNAEVHNFVSPSGYHCSVTALGTEEDNIVTCYGKIKYSRKEIDRKHMGVKLVAAFSHMLDASSLHFVIRGSNFDMHVIHDSFGSHPNDARKVHELYTHSLQNHLTQSVLQDFVASIVGEGKAKANVSRLLVNTLNPTDIVGGLF